ncbi:methyltransferase [Nonomuraea sp. ZG12]|uniref:methyltransferase n=1 Tax=Nonomuraea sp. ZG12 TaxID=3452207 RepID=UPI003F88C369
MTPYESLLAHPWIARVDHTEDGGLVVTADPAALAVRHESGQPPVLGDLVAEHLEHWGEVYDWTYRSAQGGHRPDLDLSGWRATDTGEPLPAEHMAEWADRTAELVLRHRPSRVLELGCGTGMLLHRLHPHLKGYVGTDIADHVVSRLDGLALPGVTVVRAAAHEINGAAVREALAGLGERPDCVLLNSVTQCFPSVEYLAAVLGDAIDAVAPGGTVIVGDVRHSGLLDEHYRRLDTPAEPASAESVPDGRAARRTGPQQDGRAAQRSPAADTELLFDPATLAALAANSTRRVTISLFAKTLTADTELTRYRFDAVLHVDPPASPDAIVHAWDSVGPDALAGLARQGGPIRVVGIPNGLLRPAAGAPTAASLRAVLEGTGGVVLLDPDDPMRLQVAVPATAAATPADALAGVGRPHEPLGAFARTRLAEVTRRQLRRAGLPIPGKLTAQVPTGAGRDAAALALDAVDADEAGHLALTRTGVTASARTASAPAGVAASARSGVTTLADIPDAIRRFDEIALRALASLVGGVLASGDALTADEIVAALGAAARHGWIVRRWLEVLRAEGLVRVDSGGRFLGGEAPAGDDNAERDPARATLGSAEGGAEGDSAVLDRACATLGYPPEMAVFFRTALARLPELLRDEIMAQSLLFPDGDLLTSLSKDQKNVSNTYLNAAMGHVLARAAATRATPLRVVELGAGAGGSTDAALEGLGDTDVDYLFTDVSRFFTITAEERFGDRLRYGLLDINADLVAQGAVRGGADVVIAANVLHCARHGGRSLRWMRELLAPGGLVVVTEAIREHYLVLATMQFLLSPREGEPELGAGDRRGGTGRVFFTGRELTAELAEAGLRPILELPGADSPLAAPAQHLFVAAGL